jgi:hypothetical protein
LQLLLSSERGKALLVSGHKDPHCENRFVERAYQNRFFDFATSMHGVLFDWHWRIAFMAVQIKMQTRSLTRISQEASMRTLIIVTCGMVLLSAAAHSETWQPVDKTAISVTGKVTFTPNKIIFQNGTSMAIKAATGDGMDGQVFKVLTPADPPLIQGNKLCGRATVKYLLVVGQGSRDIGLSVYDGPAVPHMDTPSCGSFSYHVGR